MDQDDADNAWDENHHEIRRTTWMSYPDGEIVPEVLLHIDGLEAWWRWNDEPFDDDPRD